MTAAVADLGLAQEGDEPGLQLRREAGGIRARAVDRAAAVFGAGGGALDLGRAFRNGLDEAGGISRAARELAGRRDLFLDRARDRGEHRADRRDRRHDAIDRRDQFLRVALQLIDLASDLLGRVLRRAGERLHLVRHHGEAASRIARAHRFDRGVEREQVGLLGDRRNEADHVADFGRRGFQPVEALSGRCRGVPGVVAQRAGFAHLPADLAGRLGEFFRGVRKL